MWRFPTLRSFGIWRFFLRVCWVVACAFVASEVVAQSQCSTYVWADANNTTTGTASSVCSSMNVTTGGTTQNTYVPSSGVPEQPPNASATGSCDDNYTYISNCQSNCSGTLPNNTGLHAVLAKANSQCSNPCSAKAGQTAFVGGASPASGAVCDGQCEVQTSQPTMTIRLGGSNSGPTIYESTYDGNQCSNATSGEAVTPTPQCVSGAGGEVCSEGASQPNCGTVNGDQVCVASIPPGTCQSFASGGVACTAVGSSYTAVQTPPAPNNGTAGTVAKPTASVTAAPGGVTETTDYYGGSVVSSSATTVVASPGGANVGNGGTSSTGSGSGTVSVTPNAANGDCGASGVSCSGSVPGSSWGGDCSDWNTCFQTFYTAVGQAPIVQGAVAIETAWPAGSCDIGSVHMSTFNQSFDYGATACQVWNNYIATPLSAVLLAVWACIGIFIVLSA